VFLHSSSGDRVNGKTVYNRNLLSHLLHISFLEGKERRAWGDERRRVEKGEQSREGGTKIFRFQGFPPSRDEQCCTSPAAKAIRKAKQSSILETNIPGSSRVCQGQGFGERTNRCPWWFERLSVGSEVRTLQNCEGRRISRGSCGELQSNDINQVSDVSSCVRAVEARGVKTHKRRKNIDLAFICL
jgi:hypothetical protein